MKRNKKTVKTEKRQYATIFDMVACNQNDMEKIQEALESGFEPFSVSQSMVQTKAPALALVENQAQPKFTMETIIWFKKSNLLPIMTQAEIDLKKLEQFEKDQSARDGV